LFEIGVSAVMPKEEAEQGLREIEEAEETLYFWLNRKSHLILRLLEEKSVINIGCGIGSLRSSAFRGLEICTVGGSEWKSV